MIDAGEGGHHNCTMTGPVLHAFVSTVVLNQR